MAASIVWLTFPYENNWSRNPSTGWVLFVTVALVVTLVSACRLCWCVYGGKTGGATRALVAHVAAASALLIVFLHVSQHSDAQLLVWAVVVEGCAVAAWFIGHAEGRSRYQRTT